MKITIELDDSILKKEVEAQVSAAFAKYTQESLEQRAKEILEAKLQRFNPQQYVEKLVEQRANINIDEKLREIIKKTYGESWSDRASLVKLSEKVVAEIVREKFK